MPEPVGSKVGRMAGMGARGLPALLVLAVMAAGCDRGAGDARGAGSAPGGPGVLLVEVPNPYYVLGEPGDPADRPRPLTGKESPEELRVALRLSLIDYYRNPASGDYGRALRDTASHCLWSKDGDTVQFACDAAVRSGAYPLWRAVRDFQNRYETMEFRLSRPHMTSNSMVFAAWREMELEGTYFPMDDIRSEFRRRSPDERVCYLRAYVWRYCPSAMAACWASERLAVINADEATAALRDIIEDTEERAKKFPNPNDHMRHLPELEKALRLSELVRKADSPTKAAAALFTLDNLSGAHEKYQFVDFALKVTLHVQAEGHYEAMTEAFKRVAAEAAGAERAARTDAERVAFEHARSTAEYWLKQYQARRDFPESLTTQRRAVTID